MRRADNRRVASKSVVRKQLVAAARKMRRETGARVSLRDAIRAVKVAVGMYQRDPE